MSTSKFFKNVATAATAIVNAALLAAIGVVSLAAGASTAKAAPVSFETRDLPHGVKAAPPKDMLHITVGNFQPDLCIVPATDTQPLRLVKKEFCTK